MSETTAWPKKGQEPPATHRRRGLCDCAYGEWRSDVGYLFGPGAGTCQACHGFLRNPRATVFVKREGADDLWVEPALDPASL